MNDKAKESVYQTKTELYERIEELEVELADHRQETERSTSVINSYKTQIAELRKDLDYSTDFVDQAMDSDIDKCDVLKRTKEIRTKHFGGGR